MALGTRYGSHHTPYESDPASYDDRYAEPVDLDVFGSKLRRQPASHPIATRPALSHDDAAPLFLSGAAHELAAAKFARPRQRGSRLLKTGALAVAALIAAFVAVKNPLPTFANAAASLIGLSSVRSTSVSEPSLHTAPMTAAATSTSVATAAPVAAAIAAPLPSRDEIAVALRTAHQHQPAADSPQASATVPPAPDAPPPTRQIDPSELANLMVRARAMLASGDISSARLLLERAAQAKEASAALMLAQTYDPTVLGTQDIRNVTPDPAMARSWYQRAAQLGSPDAQRRLGQLQ
jgi:hypothetical protein